MTIVNERRLAEKITRGVLQVLAGGGDNLAVYNQVMKDLDGEGLGGRELAADLAQTVQRMDLAYVGTLDVGLLQILAAVRSEVPPPRGFGHRLDGWSVDQWTNALCGEAGEAANVAKKMSRIDAGIHRLNMATTREQYRWRLGAELGDVVIYAAETAASERLCLASCVRESFNQKSQELGSDIKV